MPRGKPHSAEFKARPALESLQGAKTVGEVAAEHGLNPNLVRNRKARAESDVFCQQNLSRRDCGGNPGPNRNRKEAACTALSRERSR